MARAAIQIVLTVMLLSYYVQIVSAQLDGLKLAAVVKLMLPMLDDIKATVSNIEETVSNVEETFSSLANQQDDIEAKLDLLDTKQNELNIMTVTSVSSELEQNVSSEVKKTYELLYKHAYNSIYTCGGEGGWRRVVYLNVADPTTTTCPSGWHLITDSFKRTCGRFNDGSVNCASVFFPVTGGNYTRVCGSVRAYQYRKATGFQPGYTIDDPYVEGVILTHGNPQQHIWTFAAGAIEFEPNSKDPYHLSL